jgi:hypothetical protein
MFERLDGKLSRAVLRGRGGSNASLLPDSRLKFGSNVVFAEHFAQSIPLQTRRAGEAGAVSPPALPSQYRKCCILNYRRAYEEEIYE